MLKRILEPHTELAYTCLRVVTGLLFAFHGFQKLSGWHFPFPVEFGTQLWFGGLIELVTGVLMALGLLTRSAAFLASGTMAVAYIQFHWKLQGGVQLIPELNKGEGALINAFLFLYFACRGPGRHSVDAAIARRRRGAADEPALPHSPALA